MTDNPYFPHPQSLREYLLWWLCAIADKIESGWTGLKLDFGWKPGPGPHPIGWTYRITKHWPKSCMFKATLSHGGGWFLAPWDDMQKHYESVKEHLGA